MPVFPRRSALFFLIGLSPGSTFAADLPEHGCLTKADDTAPLGGLRAELVLPAA